MTAKVIPIRLPVVRGDCAAIPRPCPLNTCRFHLERGAASCALDVADDGEHSASEVAAAMGLSAQVVLAIEFKALRKFRRGIERERSSDGLEMSDSRTSDAHTYGKKITVKGETMSLLGWARHTGIHRNTIAARIESGWAPERAVTQPANDAMSSARKKR